MIIKTLNSFILKKRRLLRFGIFTRYFPLLTPSKMGSVVCLKYVNRLLKLEFKSLRSMQKIWTVGIIPICLVSKIVWGELKKKEFFFVPKVYKIKKWDNFFSIYPELNYKTFLLRTIFLILHSFWNKWKKLIFHLAPHPLPTHKNSIFVKRKKGLF